MELSEILLIGYIIWGIYAGYKFMSGRFQWLEKPAILNRIVKFIVSTIVGVYIGLFYFIYHVFKFVQLLFK